MRVAITGAAGWIGRYVIDALQTENELVLIDNVDAHEAKTYDSDSPTGRRPLPLKTDWPYRKVDILDEAGLAAALEEVEVIVHLAAMATGDWDLARSIMTTNVIGTFNVLDVARTIGVRRVVNASSVNAFGTFYWRVSELRPAYRSLPLMEDEHVVPEDPYSLSKAITELMAATFNRAFQMEVVNLRFSGVWPEQTYADAVDKGLPATASWSDDLFQWVHVFDVAQAVTKAVLANNVVSQPITIAASDTRAPEPTLQLLEKLRPELVPHIHEPLPARASLVSIARARSFLGYRPVFTLDGAVADG